jgi:hypothetical protein
LRPEKRRKSLTKERKTKKGYCAKVTKIERTIWLKGIW